MGRNNGLGGDGGGAIFSTKSKRKANGCMAAFYHLFDFQHIDFSSHHNLSIESPSRSKGLKLIQESPPSSTTYKDKQTLNISVSMRVRTETGTTSSRLKALATDTSTSSSEICNSPGSKTPSLVARLMGLDLLPEEADLNHSLTNLHTMTHHGSSHLTSHRLSKKGTRCGGTRSLPESPRVSSVRKSDFDIHRLSLQLNKENKHEEFGCSRLKSMKQQDQEENRSPRDYARQIVKQIKERVVTRRVLGTDITNSVKNREARPLQDSNEFRRDTNISCSPRTRLSDKENRPRTTHKPNSSSSFRPEEITQKPKPKPTTVILVSVSREKQNQKRVRQRELRPINQCKKSESERRFTQRPIKPTQTPDLRNKQRESFLSESTTERKARNTLQRKKFKKIPNPSDLDNKISVTKPLQKQINEAQVPKKNEEASICSSSMHKLEGNSPQVAKKYIVPNCSSKRFTILGENATAEFDHLLEKRKLEEEGEEIIAEIERDIIEALVRETASELNLEKHRLTDTTSDKQKCH